MYKFLIFLQFFINILIKNENLRSKYEIITRRQEIFRTIFRQ